MKYKTPEQFIAMVKKKKLTEYEDIVAWLKRDHRLGLGHAGAIAHVIIHGPYFELRHITGTHRDESGTLRLDGKRKRSR